MNHSWKAFVDAARETPRLYFAPLQAAFEAVGRVQDAMLATYRGNVADRADSAALRNTKRKRKPSRR